MAQSVIVGAADAARNEARNAEHGGQQDLRRDAVGESVQARKWFVLLVVAVGGFMAALNSASLIIILPTL